MPTQMPNMATSAKRNGFYFSAYTVLFEFRREYILK